LAGLQVRNGFDKMMLFNVRVAPLPFGGKRKKIESEKFHPYSKALTAASIFK